MIQVEQRAGARRPMHAAITVVCSGRPPVAARGVDLTDAGLCLTSEQRLEDGLRCTLEFNLLVQGQPEHFKLQAQVVYSILDPRGWKMGLQLSGIDARSADRIHRYIERR
jgi:hypothetical protein